MTVSATNLMLAGVPICSLIVLAMICGEGLLNSSPMAWFSAAVALTGLAAIFESLQESFASKLVLELNYDKIARI